MRRGIDESTEEARVGNRLGMPLDREAEPWPWLLHRLQSAIGRHGGGISGAYVTPV